MKKNLIQELENFKGKKDFEFNNCDSVKDKIAKLDSLFLDIAECFLNGHFEIKKGDNICEIHPTTIEFYYHEEDENENSVKDYIMYHRGKKRKTGEFYQPYPIGVINPHISGIDVTFEDQCIYYPKFRASALIRAFDINGNCEISMSDLFDFSNKKETRSTKMYDGLLSQFSIADAGFSICWVDDEVEHKKDDFDKNYRKNVAVLDSERKKIKKNEDLKSLSIYSDNKTKIEGEDYYQDIRKWQFSKK
ncbi:MAG: hypothetical protein M0P12_08225 [Paludibacteraceae bacterium]|nr:hypothetical protein [Paludibacteraceae bacterium]